MARVLSRATAAAACVAAALMCPAVARAEPGVAFEQQEGRLEISIDGRPFARYVWNEADILRPYFADLRAPNGVQVTRNHPPVEGRDATDHATMHPGLWLAFGDLAGADFWRNAGRVEHASFVERPAAEAQRGSFAVKNRYVALGKTLCEEVCRIEIRVAQAGFLIDWTSQFSGPNEFAFGDQEEMSLGVRLATPLTVQHGGQIVNSEGGRDEKQVWGRPADWCDYTGTHEDRAAGVMLMPDPQNFRRAWFHARDYGLLVANPFGRKAFTRGEPSRVVVQPGETFRLRFGVLVHSGLEDREAAYREWLTGK